MLETMDCLGVCNPFIHGGPMKLDCRRCRIDEVNDRSRGPLSYGGGENTGNVSSGDGPRGFNSLLGGEPKEIRVGSR